MKLNYNHRLFVWFGVIFLVFAVGVAVVEQSRSKTYKTEALEERLDAYAGVIDRTLARGYPPDSLADVLPANLRVTLIDSQGVVTYDNTIADISHLENHAHRPEVVAARSKGSGSNIRVSASNGHAYLYYARLSGDRFVRVAMPYDIHVKRFLRADNGFLYFIIALFAVGLFFIDYAAGRFGSSIRKLRSFTLEAESGKTGSSHEVFPDDELGDIGRRIVKNYNDLDNSRLQLSRQREKLLQHVHSSEEGVCFFNPDREVEFYNGLFLQYLNLMTGSATVKPPVIFSNPLFAGVATFLSGPVQRGEARHFETSILSQGRHFAVQVNIFDDSSFEMIIRDDTRLEQTRRLKQEMTGNIAPELRTPVTSIRGYLENILEQRLDPEKERDFLSKAYGQTLALSELISDMSLITKIEEAPGSFESGEVNIPSLVGQVMDDLAPGLARQGIKVNVAISPDTVVRGNSHLLYSVFRNLTENVINHAGRGEAGRGLEIAVSRYNADEDFYYFSFADNGVGIEDEGHLNRLFERFYRVTEGRTRDSGGSGLGLSIVKNAITFHRGSISVKNRAGGGLEFLFKLPRATDAV